VLLLPTRGGRRPGAGRKPKGDETRLPHVERPRLSRHHPVHVTVRVRPHVWSLRSQRGMAVVESALRGAARSPGFRVARYSVQGNHVHLVVEAATTQALTSGMKALAIRLARGMNRIMDSRGPVLEDRYHTHVLRTPAEVHRALAYVAGNFAGHARRRGEAMPAGFQDPFGSDARPDLVARPATWLLRRAMTSAESSDGE
jgi:putative transposase